MPTLLDIELRPEAESMINEFGQPVLVRLVDSEYDPATGDTTVENTDVDTKGVLQGYNARLLGVKISSSGSSRPAQIEEGDLELIVPGVPFDDSRRPTPNDKVYLGDEDEEENNIVSVQMVSTGEQDALYILQLRGAVQ